MLDDWIIKVLSDIEKGRSDRGLNAGSYGIGKTFWGLSSGK